MDPISAIIIFILGITALCQYGVRLKIQDEYDNLRAELEYLLEAIEKSKATGKLSMSMLKTQLARLVFREYLKLFLENKLQSRLNMYKNDIATRATKDVLSKKFDQRNNGTKN